MKKINTRKQWCPKCQRWIEMIIIGRKMHKPYEVVIWEANVVCVDCGFRMWIPCEPPNKERKDEKNKPT